MPVETNTIASTEQNLTTSQDTQVKYPDNKAVIAYLCEKFPLCFSVTQPKPLKVGIFQDLIASLDNEEELSKTKLRQAIRQYTSSWAYLASCQVGAKRVDLIGEDCGELDQQQAEHAAQRLAESKAVVAQRQAARKAQLAEKKAKRQVKEHKEQKKKIRRPAKPALTSVNLTTLQAHHKVKIKAGNRTQNATVLEVLKDGARVELENGLVINITADRLYQ
ncbi:RNA chaperone ProQ [Mergibacter septicus]|uniref:RNA chaperone ProQ n=1 Tax=Mergibacter septicus TaxID=221402 RepID=A0A8E3MGK4_9PAST|nr:RNA chaperone ProQ [Mergibacter septicus]AWX15710.1 RNA chaperone ProQ [Mergibacter septicus]QDJ14963.1 RNA chaperone ProQ [Mergibacter septicus]UTU47613.1 RNA chaperone ProQ [Mergibacter septicus]WMR96781.1 RNA chaperone ProQ [Mergibacter septicus]